MKGKNLCEQVFVQSVPSILAWNAGEKGSTVQSKRQQNVPNPRSRIMVYACLTGCFQRSASMVLVEKGLLDARFIKNFELSS